jgi:hypothetical protein
MVSHRFAIKYEEKKIIINLDTTAITYDIYLVKNSRVQSKLFILFVDISHHTVCSCLLHRDVEQTPIGHLVPDT